MASASKSYTKAHLSINQGVVRDILLAVLASLAKQEAIRAH
jgi:hypothetical protein